VSDLNEQEQVELAKNWLKDNGLWIVAGVAIGALGLAGWGWYNERRATQAETASARYEEAVAAFQRGDPARGNTLVEELNRDYAWTPYSTLGTLLSARVQVEANELDKAAAGLKSVMETAADEEVRLIARERYARVLSAQGKHDEALAALAFAEVGEFAPRFADVRGDVLLAKGDRAGALREYLAARSAQSNGRVDADLLELKIRDLGGAPPKPSSETVEQDS
jgi:predicted negative regulator of RcsB-dependent stress response